MNATVPVHRPPALLTLATAALLSASLPAEAQTPPPMDAPAFGERAVLSAGEAPSVAEVLGHIVQYTRWPQPPEPLAICLLANGDVQQPLLAALVARAGVSATVQLLPLGLPPANNGGPMAPSNKADALARAQASAPLCHVMVIADAAAPSTAAWLAWARQRPVLTLGPGQGFCSQGGAFCLTARSSEGHWRFAVNTDTLTQARLQVNPRVLRLGRGHVPGTVAAGPAQ